MALRNVSPQLTRLQYFDIRRHSHYPVLEFRSAPNCHSNDNLAVASANKLLSRMQLARFQVGLRVSIEYQQLDLGLRTVNYPECPFGVRCRIMRPGIGKARRLSVLFEHHRGRKHSFDGEIENFAREPTIA